MTKMVNYIEPEPEFESPADINSKEEPVVISNAKQEEVDEIAARVRAMNTGKVFEADKPTPDKTELPPKPPELSDMPWYKKQRIEQYQEVKREPPLIERRKQFTLTPNKRSKADVDRIIRSGNFHVVGGERIIHIHDIYIPDETPVEEVKPVKKGWFKK